MPKITVNGRIESLRKRYAEDYDIESLNSSNDRNNLEQLLRYTIALEDLSDELNMLIEKGASENAQELVRLSNVIDTFSAKGLALEKQLGIDRKTRKTENNVESPAEYITKLKIAAREFLNERLIKMYCPDCNVLVMRFVPAHDHTLFDFRVKCSQCDKVVTAKRDGRDIFYDLQRNDKDWRRKYPIEVEQSKKTIDEELESIEDDLVLGGENAITGED